MKFTDAFLKLWTGVNATALLFIAVAIGGGWYAFEWLSGESRMPMEVKVGIATWILREVIGTAAEVAKSRTIPEPKSDVKDELLLLAVKRGLCDVNQSGNLNILVERLEQLCEARTDEKQPP